MDNSKVGMIVLAVGMLAVGLAAGYYFGNSSDDVAYQTTATPTAMPSETLAPTPTSTQTSNPTPPPGWKTYTNQNPAFALKYPPHWSIQSSEFNDGSGSVVLAGSEGNLTIIQSSGLSGGDRGACDTTFGGQLESIKLGGFSNRVCNIDGNRGPGCSDCVSGPGDFAVRYWLSNESYLPLFRQILATFQVGS